MNKLLTSIVLALFLFSVSVMAQSGSSKGVELSIKNVKNAINANDYAEFDIVITNNQQKDSDFFVAKNFYSEKWRVTADPYLVSVGSGFTRSTRLSIQPTKFLLPAKYKLVVLVESRDKTFSKELSFEVEIVPFGDDNVKTELIIDDKIDPRFGSTARVSLESLYNFGISNVRLSLYSDLFSFEKNFNLKANEKRVEKFQLDFDDDVELGEYTINAVVTTGDGVLGTDDKRVVLSPYSEVTEKIFRSNRFNKKIIITKENTGTEKSSEEVRLELSTIEKMLARFNVKPDSLEKIDGRYLAVWRFSLDPGDKKDVVVNLPYGTYLLILLVIALLTYIVTYLTKTKVGIVKKVIDVTKDRDGIKGVKVILHLKNKGNKAVEKIRIIDYLPRLIGASSQDFGTLKPTRAQKSPDGRMRLVWDLDGLKRGEERIVSYVARSKLSILGRLLLPEAVVEYQSGKKHNQKRSNRLTLLTRASRKERNS